MHYVVQHLRLDRRDRETGHPVVDLRLYADPAVAWSEAARLAGMHGLGAHGTDGSGRPPAYAGPAGSVDVVPLEVRS